MLVVYGPTVTGKTALAIKLAKKFNGELISADSRQIYKGLDIGTGKVSFTSKVEKRKGYWIVDDVKIYGFDIIEPGKRFSASNFVKFASTTMIHIIESGKLPIIVGGTGFYIKALIEGLQTSGIPPNTKLRKDLEKSSAVDLYKKLLTLDSIRAKSMNQSDKNNPRRLIRAIEIAMSNQYQVSSIKYQANIKYSLIGLTAPNNYLYARADDWLTTRLEKGLVEEVMGLITSGVDTNWLESLGLEYRWITRFILGKISKDEAITRLKGDIHSFIRRQKTWFLQFKEVELYDIANSDYQSIIENKIAL